MIRVAVRSGEAARMPLTPAAIRLEMQSYSTVISSTRNQFTIAHPASVSGIGYWSGRDVCVEFRPAEPDTGIVFVRHDLPRHVRIPARLEFRVEAQRRTTLANGDVQVEMVEHVLAALFGLQIDNCEIYVNAPEIPGLDGSSQSFVEALDGAGLVYQDAPCRQLLVHHAVRAGDAAHWIEIHPLPVAELKVKYLLDYGVETAIGRQTLAMTVTPTSFRRELAPSRTFLTQDEARWLQAQGLGSRVTTRDLLVFDAQGPVENTLRFPDECVRHKVLDVVGDLALAGCSIVGHVIAHRSGHRLNAAVVREALAKGQMTRKLKRTA